WRLVASVWFLSFAVDGRVRLRRVGDSCRFANGVGDCVPYRSPEPGQAGVFELLGQTVLNRPFCHAREEACPVAGGAGEIAGQIIWRQRELFDCGWRKGLRKS